jgi:hypothetical protein
MPEGSGRLRIGVRPWAEVIVDGTSRGTTPLRPLSLSVGVHSVRLVNPDYHPFLRKVAIRDGETTALDVDFRLDGVRK